MRRGDPERRLSTMSRPLGNAREQQRTAGDRLQMFIGLRQAHEDIPPVVDEGDHARGQPAACEVMRGEAAPTPLVLQFVERVLDRPVMVTLKNLWLAHLGCQFDF